MDDSRCSAGAATVGLAAISGLAGAALGTLIGSFHHDRWVAVPQPWKLEPR